MQNSEAKSTMIEESQLTKCFEMLIERLDAVEAKCEYFQKYIELEQNNKLGHINTWVWGQDVDLYVHEPRVPSKLFERPQAFLVKTNFYDPGWQYRMSWKNTLDGDFDDVLCGCDLALTKRLLLEYDEREVMCQWVGLKSSRVDVLDHLGDIQLNRWLQRQDSKLFQALSCNWCNSDSVSFWLIPSKNEDNWRVRKTSIQECVHTLLKMLRDLDGTSERLEIQVFPATIQEMDLLKTLDMVEYRLKRGVDDTDTTLEEKAIQAIQDDRCLVEAIEQHFEISCSKDILRLLSHLL